METKSALVRSDGAVKLYTETIVYLHLAFVVYPRNAEQNISFGSYKALKKRPSFLYLSSSASITVRRDSRTSFTA